MENALATAIGETEIQIVNDIVLSETLNIPATCTIILKDDGVERTISRGASMTSGSMFALGGESTLKFASTGRKDAPRLIIDGNNVVSDAPGVSEVLLGTTVDVDAGVVFRNHSSSADGGVFKVSGGTLNVAGAVFLDNSSRSSKTGGAISSKPASRNLATIDISDTVFTGNSAGWGGAICVGPKYSGTQVTLKVTNSTFNNNSATENGGAIILGLDTDATLTNNTFSENQATKKGCDIFSENTTRVTLTGKNSALELYLNGEFDKVMVRDDFAVADGQITIKCGATRYNGDVIVTASDATDMTTLSNCFVLGATDTVGEGCSLVTSGANLVLSGNVAAIAYDYTTPDVFNITDWKNYLPKASTSLVMSDGTDFWLPASGSFETMQGGCSDGTYAYFLLENNDDEDARVCKLFKVNMSTWKVEKESAVLAVGHGNSITYDGESLVVAHCKPDGSNISYIDPSTLEITSTVTLTNGPINSLAYNSTQGKSVVALKGSTDKAQRFAIVNGKVSKDTKFTAIQPAKIFNGDTDGLNFQSVACDENYIYTLYCGDRNLILRYDWNGTYQGVYEVDLRLECEAFFKVGEKYYMTFYTVNNGGIVREIKF